VAFVEVDSDPVGGATVFVVRMLDDDNRLHGDSVG
jgi:hypothetical protein